MERDERKAMAPGTHPHPGQPRGHYRSAEDGSPVWVPPAVTVSDDEINANIAEFLERQEQHPPMMRPMPAAPENPLEPLRDVARWVPVSWAWLMLGTGLAVGTILGFGLYAYLDHVAGIWTP